MTVRIFYKFFLIIEKNTKTIVSIRLQFGSLHKDALELGPWYETPCCFVRVLILSVDVRMVCRSRTTVRVSQLYKRHYFPP